MNNGSKKNGNLAEGPEQWASRRENGLEPMLQSLILLSFTKINLPWSNLIPFSSCCSHLAQVLHVWIITVLYANAHFPWPNSLKIRGLLFIAGRDLVPGRDPDAEQVGTVESQQAAVCDGDNLLGNIVSLFLRNRLGSSVFASLFGERVSQASGSTYRVNVVAYKHTHTHTEHSGKFPKVCHRQNSKECALTV